MQSIFCMVLRPAERFCATNGVSKHVDTIELVVNGVATCSTKPVLYLARHGDDFIALPVPPETNPDGQLKFHGLQFGGNFAFSSHSDFWAISSHPIKIYDRDESLIAPNPSPISETRKFTVSIWDGWSRHTSELEASSYASAYSICSGRYPPGYIWTISG